jgi:hypothetical protein
MKQKVINVLSEAVFLLVAAWIIYNVYLETGIYTAGLAGITLFMWWYFKGVVKLIYKILK